MIQKLIINKCWPFSLVESDDFKLLVLDGYPTLKVISRPTLMKRFDSNTSEILKNMKKFNVISIKYIKSRNIFNNFIFNFLKKIFTILN